MQTPKNCCVMVDLAFCRHLIDVELVPSRRRAYFKSFLCQVLYISCRRVTSFASSIVWQASFRLLIHVTTALARSAPRCMHNPFICKTDNNSLRSRPLSIHCWQGGLEASHPATADARLLGIDSDGLPFAITACNYQLNLNQSSDWTACVFLESPDTVRLPKFDFRSYLALTLDRSKIRSATRFGEPRTKSTMQRQNLILTPL